METVVDDRDELEWPVTHRTRNTTITHDSLYRVMSVDYSYNLGSGSTGTDASSDWRSEAAPINTNDPGDRTARAGARSATSTRRTRHPAPADLVGALPSTRVVNLDYEWDWLGNEVSRLDDAWSFYERSLGTLTSGNDANASAPRPSALYLATNIDDVGGVESTWDGAGWVEVQYGVSGNVTSFTVHGECHDVSSGSCVDDPTDTLATRIASLRTQCSCATEQHYSFRWDELNRLVDGRRYDRNSTTSGAWVHGARLRYRYDGANQRTVKEVLTDPTTGGGGDGGFGVGHGVGGGGGGWTTSDRVTLFVYPGDYERRGLTRTWSGYQAITTGTDATETQYLVAGARIVWDSAGDGLLPPIDRNRRATINVTDLLGTTGAVVDLLSGDLVEVSTYYPNGARENLWTNDALVPLEPMGFTTKEADEEIGVTYFGERWLIPRLGRWATPDPLEIHATDGGEVLNSYHYVSGNLMQARDPLGLCAEGLTVDECQRFEGTAMMMYQIPLSNWRHDTQLGPGLFGGLPNTVSTGVPSPLGMALRDILFVLKNNRVAHVLIDRYLQRQAGMLRLTGDDFADIATPEGLDPRAPNGERPNAFVTEVGRLRSEGGGTSHVRWGTSSVAFPGGTLGQYGVVWEGDLTVAADGTYSFSGTVHAEDFYDFDPRPLFGPNARQSGWAGEVQTDLMYLANIGVGFEVRTEDVAVSFTQSDVLVPIRAPGDGSSRSEQSAAGRAEGVEGVVDGVGVVTAGEVGDAVSGDPAEAAGGR